MSFVQVEPVESLVLSPIPNRLPLQFIRTSSMTTPRCSCNFHERMGRLWHFGYGDQNGQPLRAGEYFSWDEEGDYPMNKSLNDHLAGTIPDEKLRKKVTQQVLEWIWKKSDEVFYIEQ